MRVCLCVRRSDKRDICTVSPYCMLHKEHVSHMVGLRRTGSRFITECNPLQPFSPALCIQRLHFKNLVRTGVLSSSLHKHRLVNCAV